MEYLLYLIIILFVGFTVVDLVTTRPLRPKKKCCGKLKRQGLCCPKHKMIVNDSNIKVHHKMKKKTTPKKRKVVKKRKLVKKTK